MTDASRKSILAASFDHAADTFERARPSYPAEAVDWLLASGPRAVLDLGAGTGKLTRALAGRTPPPVRGRSQPEHARPTRGGRPRGDHRRRRRQAIPLPDASVDAVLLAQAWHWVDPGRAVPEIRRVLRPGGLLGLIWNVRDESVPWVAGLTRLMHPSAAESFVAEGEGLPDEVGPVERLEVTWRRPFDRQGLLDLVSSRSYVISAPPEEREGILREVSGLLDSHPELAGRTEWQMPYRTVAFRMRTLAG